jgi:hypothetical protein
MEDNMITFKSHNDLRKLHPNDPAFPVMKSLVKQLIDDFTTPGHPYVADDYGYLILIEPDDVDRELNEIDMPKLTEIFWEGASMRDGFIYAVYLGTDDYGMGFLIPDADWVNGRLRETLESILDQPQQVTPSTNPEEIHNEET